MVKAARDLKVADELCEDCGYEPELKRTLGSFQVFAVSFAFISVAVGIFGAYDDVLQNSGPVGIWLWPIVALGQTLIALVIAQFAARIPLSGSSYQWASRLANPKIGWLFGWLSFCYLAAGVVTVDNAMASTALMPLFGMQPDENTARVITLVVLLIQAVLVVLSTRLVGLITSGAVGLELVIVVVLTVALFIAVAIAGEGSVSNLTSRGIADGAPNYFAVGGGLAAAMIMGLVRSRAVRNADCGRRAGVVGPRGVGARIAARGLDRSLDFGRRPPRRRGVLRLPVDIQPRGNGNRAGRRGRLQALIER